MEEAASPTLDVHDLGPNGRWLFAEFDRRWDPLHGRYVLAWAGRGPQGGGLYLLELLPR